MSKKIVFFLPGKGKMLDEYEGLPNEIAKRFGAELEPLRAPYPHPKPEKAAQGRRTWFNKIANKTENREDADVEEYRDTLRCIEDRIDQAVQMGVNPKDIVLFGHSMGAGLAVHAGLEMTLGAVVAVAPDMPYNLQYQMSSNTPIYWFECKNDTVLNDNRKKSYQLVESHPNFHRAILENSTHDEFGKDLLIAMDGIFGHGKEKGAHFAPPVLGKTR